MMPNACRTLPFLLVILLTVTLHAGTGFEELFNGKDLNGWEGLPGLWSVEDGAMTGRTTADNPIKFNTFLVWRGGTVGDFELHLKYRIVGGNSGIQYRSKLRDDKKFIVTGYQADLEAGTTHSGILYEEGGRGILAQRGQRVTIKPDGTKAAEQRADTNELQANIKGEDWNDYVVVAHGNHLVHRINGKTTAEIFDEQSSHAAAKGILALQLHAGPAMTVQFKDIRLRHLDDKSPHAPTYTPVAKRLEPPTGLDAIGYCHGDVATSSNGEIFLSVEQGDRSGIQVYGPDGVYRRNIPDAPNDFHGFVIHREASGEFIYGARLRGQSIIKMKLDGTAVLTIPASAFPSDLMREFNGTKRLLLTGVDVAPDGRIFAVDGYSTDYIHVFSPDGKYLKSFGGKQPPYSFATNHKIAIDTRFDPARILCTDRENRRMVQLSLDGEIMNITPDIKRPAAVAVYGDLAAVGEIEGRISFLDKSGHTVLTVGENFIPEQYATPAVTPDEWRTGIVTAPHGVAFDKAGNLFVTEFNNFGRVLRYLRGE